MHKKPFQILKGLIIFIGLIITYYPYYFVAVAVAKIEFPLLKGQSSPYAVAKKLSIIV